MLTRGVIRTINAAQSRAASSACLVNAFPGVSTSTATYGKPELEVSSLSNGVKVATDSAANSVASVSISVDAGSRFENECTAGSALMLEHVVFRGSTKRSAIRIFRDLEDLGASVSASASREQLVVTASAPAANGEVVVAALAELVATPKLSPWEIRDAKPTVDADLKAAAGNVQIQLTEALYAAAFGEAATLGRPLYVDAAAHELPAESVAAHWAHYVGANSVSIAAVGLSHSALKNAAAQLTTLGTAAGPRAAAAYVGGEERVKAASDKTHVALAFAAPILGAANSASYCVLKALLNGSGAQAFSAAHADAGLFGLYGSSAAGEAGALVDALIAQLKDVAATVPSADAVAAARAAAKIATVSCMDTDAGRLRCLGLSASFGVALPNAASAASAFDAVSGADVQAAARALIASAPSIASFGSVAAVPRYAALVNKLK